MIVEKVYLLGNGSCWNDWQDVCDQQVHFLSIFSLSDPETDALSIFSITSSAVDKWWMESVNIVMLSQKCETWIKYVITFSDGNVSAFICLEVFLEFVKLRIAILDSNYLLFGENDGLGPLNKRWSLLIFP
jgi:hypothetical protein